MSSSVLSKISNTTQCKRSRFPKPIVQYIFNSCYSKTVSSTLYLANKSNGIYDLKLQSTVFDTVGGKSCLRMNGSYGTVDTSVTSNSVGLINSGTTYPAVTFTMWFYCTSTNGSGLFTWNKLGTTPTDIYTIEFQLNGSAMYLWIQKGSVWVSIGTVTLNTWTFVSLVFDGTTYKTYMNTTAGGTGTDGSTNNTYINANRDVLYVGLYGSSFAGSMADFRMYGSALTASQLTDIYNAGASTN